MGSGFLLKKAIKKYGKDNFEKIILESVSDEEELNLKEKYWIKFYNALDSDEFYNLTEGGQGGYLGDQVNEKRRLSLLGHKLSEETKSKIAQKKVGTKASEETKLKQKNAHKGIDHFWLKSANGAENPNSKKVKQLSLDGNLIKIWDYQKLASKELGVSEIGISACLNGYQKTCGGFKWERT